MSGYTPNKWVDREGTTRYFETIDADGAKIFTPDYTQVTEMGTPVNEDNMNHIEEGIAAGSFSKYDSMTTYEKDDLVTAIIDNELKVYKSLQDNNNGNTLTDTTFWEEVEFAGGGAGLQLFDVIEKDHILTYEESKGLTLLGSYVYKDAVAGSRYGYPDFYNKVVAEKEAGTPTETTLGSNTVTMYVNSNGHIFYDIADKGAVDAWYETYGKAEFYGVDIENERIFLPYPEKTRRYLVEKNENIDDAGFYNIYSDGWCEQGGWTAKATNNWAETGTTLYKTFASTNYNLNVTTTGGTNINAAQYKISSQSVGSFRAMLSGASSSYGDINGYRWLACGYLAEGQYPKLSDNTYEYMCVGNTEVSEAVTGITEVTTTENDTIPLGYSTYQNGSQPSISWLKSEGQWNDGNVYTTFYNEFVQKIGQAFASGFVKEITDEYDDYDLVINQTDMTFRLPLYDGSESLLSEKKINIKDQITQTGQSFIAPANGWYYLQVNAGGYADIYNVTKGSGELTANGTSNASRAFTSVLTGDEVRYYYNGTISTAYFMFAQGNGSLYFKVANAVQNLELLDAGYILENCTTKSMVDGQWVPINEGFQSVYTSTAIGTYTIDLSTYLPNDGYVYEVIISGVMQGASNTCAVNLETSLVKRIYFMQTDNSQSNTWVRGSCILPIGINRQLTINPQGTVPITLTIHIHAYRRVGTNE